MHLRAAQERAPTQGQKQVSSGSQLDVQEAKGLQGPVSGLCGTGAKLCRVGSRLIRPSGHRSRPALYCLLRLQVLECKGPAWFYSGLPGLGLLWHFCPVLYLGLPCDAVFHLQFVVL